MYYQKLDYKNEKPATEFIKSLKKIYVRSFSAEERISFTNLCSLVKKEKVSLTAVKNDLNECVGMVIYEDLTPDTCYVDYLAFTKRHRKHGYGSQVLKDLLSKKKRVICSIETPAENIIEFKGKKKENLKKIRQKDFYLKRGFYETGVFYMNNNVRYELLCSEQGYVPDLNTIKNKKVTFKNLGKEERTGKLWKNAASFILVFFLMLIIIFFFDFLNCSAATFDLTRTTDDEGANHYYIEYEDGSYQEITEDEYYQYKYEETDETEETQETNTETTMVIPGDAGETTSDTSTEAVLGDGVSIVPDELSSRSETIVLSQDDVNEDNFQNVKKIQNGDVISYYVLLQDNYYAQITEDLYYLFLYRYERYTGDASEINEEVDEAYEETGEVTLKGVLNEDIEGYTIYVKIKKYYGNEEFSYFLYDPDYTETITLPVGEYYIMNGGLLNDYSYTYPISNPDFVVEENTTTTVYFTVGDAEIPEEYQTEETEDEEYEEEETISENTEESVVTEEDETVTEDTTDAEEDVKNTISQIIPNIIMIAIIGGVIIFILFIRNKNKHDEDDDIDIDLDDIDLDDIE